MDEQDWLTCADSLAMLNWLRANRPIGDRRLRLLAVAVSRLIGGQDLPGGDGLEAAWRHGERIADRLGGTTTEVGYYVERSDPGRGAQWLMRGLDPGREAASAALVREIAGNPFMPPYLDGSSPIADERTWRTGFVRGYASSVYAERDWAHLPIMADMLEDQGCTEVELLAHLRSLERCPVCLPLRRGLEACRAVVGDARSAGAKASMKVEGLACSACADGWVPLRGPHILGCWAVDVCRGVLA